MSATTERIHNIEELRDAVEAQLDELHHMLVGNLGIDINLYDTLFDLSYKVMNMLYCVGGQYCRMDNAIIDAYDIARDIERVAEIAHMPEYARVGEKVARMIFNYMYEYEDVGGTDE